MLPITYQQLGDLRVLSNPAVGRQESHESGDCLAMDGQEQETTGKRKTKNSTSLVEGDRDLAKAKKESESMAKKDEELRKKEEKALEYALLVSGLEARRDGTLLITEQEAHRKEEAAHLLSVQTSTSTESSQLLLLGTVASSSTCVSASTSLVARISQGKEECDPTDQVLDRDDFSPFSSFDLSDSNPESGEDQKRESTDSLSILPESDGLLLVAASDEVTDMNQDEPAQQRISSKVLNANEQRLLNEMEVQYQFNKTMERYANEPPSSKSNDNHVDLSEEKKVADHNDGNASESSVGSHRSRVSRDFQSSSIDLNSQSGESRGSVSERGSISGQSSSSSGSNIIFTKEIYTQLMASSDKWSSEIDVISDMKNLALTETKVSIRSEVMAGIVFESRPVCEVSQLLKVQQRNFEKAHKELEADLAKIKREETRKIQQARRLLEKKMNECDDKSRELDSKIKATSLFSVGRDSVSALETALEASDQENRTLKDRVKVLEASLKDMLSSGVQPSSLKGKGIMTRIKLEPSCSPPNPARSSLSASGYSSASSATSLPSSSNSSSCVEDNMYVAHDLHRIKRELSPASKLRDDDLAFKKPKQQSTPWTRWNSEGIDAAEDFVQGQGRQFLQTKSVDELTYLRTRLAEAQDDFKNLFPKDLPMEQGISQRDSEQHLSYSTLQFDLGIPPSHARRHSLHFYYGKLLGAINNILRKRASFRRHPQDQKKITALCAHLGSSDPTVVAFLAAERNMRKINERSPCVAQQFEQNYTLACQRNAAQPLWLHRSNFRNIQDNLRDRVPMPLSDRDPLYNDCFKQFSSFFYNLHLHEIMSFYERARAFAVQRPGNRNGGAPQARN